MYAADPKVVCWDVGRAARHDCRTEGAARTFPTLYATAGAGRCGGSIRRGPFRRSDHAHQSNGRGLFVEGRSFMSDMPAQRGDGNTRWFGGDDT
jgi:hypothetical protein